MVNPPLAHIHCMLASISTIAVTPGGGSAAAAAGGAIGGILVVLVIVAVVVIVVVLVLRWVLHVYIHYGHVYMWIPIFQH